ncbi:hypothetical protein F5Y09DRAFT_355202 [Xylaria sp. FL1042]|nr:hypothetical protein F5Y09DRAFT_355202 [Xylaria sp. FL1042]
MDNQIPAGLRPSGSNLSLRPISNGTGSSRSTTSHIGSYRHALLKSNSQRQQPIEKDLPVPPVLTDCNPTPIVQCLAPQEPDPQTPRFIGIPIPSIELVAPDSADIDNSEAGGDRAYSSIDGYNHFRTWRLPVSKVRAAVCSIEGDGDIDVRGKYPPVILVPSNELYSVEQHFQHSHPNTPKVRPFTEASYLDASHLQEGGDEIKHASAPYFASQDYPQDSREPQKAAIYWGFLPKFKEKRGKELLEAGQPEVSQQPTVNGQPENIETSPKQENIRQGDKTSDKDSGTSKGHCESQTISKSGGERSGRSVAAVSPPSLLASGSVTARKEQESLQPQKPGTGRAAVWLRKLLGYPEADAPPTLTKLPEKSSAQQGSREDVSSVASGVTTYSFENAANRKAIDNAMNGMETILTEALSLADEAGKREYGHVDDGNLPLNPPSEISIHTPSVNESIRQGSSEHEGAIIAIPLPNELTAIGRMDDESKVPPCEGVKRPGLVKSIKRDGKILRPSFLKRARKTARNIESHRHAIDDDCVLSVPAPRGGNTLTSEKELKSSERGAHQQPICTHGSSMSPCEAKEILRNNPDPGWTNRLSEIRHHDMSVCSLDGGTSDDAVDFSTQYSMGERRYRGFPSFRGASRRARDENPAKDPVKSRKKRTIPTKHDHELRNVSLRNRSHVSIAEGQRFSLTKSARRQPIIARDWSPGRKRFVASVACISTALIGVLVGIYAGLVPSIQYYIADFHHYTILGNVGLYLGMALPNFFFWPLPLLHGRKPYIVGGLCIAMPLLFPQAMAIGTQRSPTTSIWRVALLLSRALMGFALGFAKMNFHSILTDLFGASLMSKTPHQEVVDEYDVRRHGGGLGVWLGIWTWCFIGSISVGFVVGAVVIEHLQPSWGLYISIIIIAAVLLLNVLCPEVRRSAWRRSVAEVRLGETISRRLARGEVMMHRVQTGPKWWGQEVYHGVALSLEMLRQPGFTIMAVYSAWIYAQVILIIVLLGSLTSKSYRFRSPYVGAVVSSVAVGAFLAIPFQKANIFSRARNMNPKSNKMTFDRKITWSSHLVRRAIFTFILPIAGIVYTVVSTGPPVHVFFPSFFAALIGFLSCLAISECNGMLMENWDCSDLQPGMTGRSKSSKDSHKRTNYSSFPRATAGWNFIQSLGFIFAAGATGLGGSITRRLGQRTATGIVAGILFILTLLLLGTFIRFKRVQIIPDCTCSEMDRWKKERRISLHNWAAAMTAAKEKGNKELNEIPEDDVG